MTTPSDLEINRNVRRVLVKHWIDLGRIAVHSSTGRLSMHGRIQRIDGRSEPLVVATLDNIMAEIRRIPGVRRIVPHFDNWQYENGSWRLVDSLSISRKTGEPAEESADETPENESSQ